MRHYFLGVMTAFVLGACNQRSDVAYCERLGTGPGSREYAHCIGYFTRQSAWFNNDLQGCSVQADQTYPQSLYDRGSYGIMRGGLGWGNVGFGGIGHGPFYNSRMIDIPPNYHHNAQVDSLRMRIIEPCMQAKGWHSGFSWEAGRKDGKILPAPLTPPSTSGALPWLKK